jgi:hypothetical protein
MNTPGTGPKVVGGFVVLLAAGLAGGTAYWWNRTSSPAPSPEEPPAAAALFQDVTAGAGVNFAYRNGEEAGHYAILESLGGGVALIDYDGDGLLDVFVTGGGYFGGPDKKEIRGHPCRLYRNLGGWKFRDVTAEVGLDRIAFYTHGCAVADYNRDGWPDLLVTGWGRVALFRNEPDPHDPRKRRFRDVTAEAKLKEGGWSTSAAWADFDGDGYPDLYVCHYVNWSFANHPPCPGYGVGIPRDVCPPKQFKGLPHQLYRNNGDGTFTDVSAAAGLRIHGVKDRQGRQVDVGKGLGVVCADFTGTRRPGIYVANDTVANFLYLLRGLGKVEPAVASLCSLPRPGLPVQAAVAELLQRRFGGGPDASVLCFDEVGLFSGVALDDGGVANGSMGVDVADYDGSGLASLFVANYEREHHALYRNLGSNEQFLYSTAISGIGAIGQNYVGFGTCFFDVTNGGLQDLVVVNGHVIRHPVWAPLKQRPILLRNVGGGRFADMTAQGGPYFRTDHCGRGLAVGDLDNDGRPDLVISHVNEPVALLRNVAGGEGPRHHWLGLALAGAKHRDLVGSRVTVEVDGQKRTGFVKGGGSYLSASDPRLLFGLGKAQKVSRVTVEWSWGHTQHWEGAALAVDRYWQLVEGEPAAQVWPVPRK